MATNYQVMALSTAFFGFTTSAQAGDWVIFVNESQQRMISAAELGLEDTKEKDYIWGDVDQDGDIDLVVVRKSVGSNFGPFRNVLFMNEGVAQGHQFDGVLVDRTNEYATDATDAGNGFLDLTNDRDVVLVDVNGDDWLDIVTTVTYGQAQPKTISHPRVYINKGNDGGGNWLGFRYEEPRIPTLVMVPNSPTIAYGDVTGDGAPDLYIGDYFNNLEDRLLVNIGNGYFVDETNQRVSAWFTTSQFTSHAVIADLNHDGYNDIIKTSSLGPYDLRVAYNDPAVPGIFSQANGQIIAVGSEYFVAVDDLNNDGLLDVVEANDSADRYYLNQGNGGDGQVTWISFAFPNSSSGFDNNTVIADLDNDGWKDVLIADVDVDLPNCSSRLDIHHNLGNPPYITFQEDVGNLPTNNGGPLYGTHDVAVFDIDGDCWLDLVIGNCDGTTIWINQGKGNICSSCPEDLNGDGFVGTADLLSLLAQWGTDPGGPPDFDGDGTVGTSDLLILLAHWGSCD